MNLTELSKSIRFDNASKGFDPTEGGVNRYVLLAVSEICEAQNELRDGHEVNHIYYGPRGVGNFGPLKPEGFPVEIADAIIRLLDIGAKFEYDFDKNRVLPILIEGYDIDSYLLKVINILTRVAECKPNDWNFTYYLSMALSCLFTICEEYDIDSMAVITEKLEYNRSRPPKHGRQF